MKFNVFLFVNLIVLSFSLKETLGIYKAMTELKPPLQKEACSFKIDEDDANDNYEYVYVQPCQEGYHCGNKNHDISTCIPNYFGQKVGEDCNYDDECLLGDCDSKSKKCTYNKPVYDELSYSYRCAEGLVYYYKEKKCIDKTKYNILDGYCTYTKKGEKEPVNIEPNEPFYVCGEVGTAGKNQPELEPDTPYVKISKVGSLKTGSITSVEYACNSGAVSKVKDSDYWMCDKIKSMKTWVEDNKKYVEYDFEKAGKQKFTEDDYDGGYFYYNMLNGEYEAYSKDYHKAFDDYYGLMKKYEKKCVSKSHDYYFRPLDCGIKEIADAAFYLDKIYFYTNSTKEAKTVRDYFLGEDYTTRSVSSETLSFKKSLFILFVIFALF